MMGIALVPGIRDHIVKAHATSRAKSVKFQPPVQG
jgi:hypothetical protein